MTEPNGGPGGPEKNGADDFAAMLDAYGKIEVRRLSPGDRVSVRVIHLSKESAFCAISPTQEGTIPIEELCDEHGKLTVSVGDTVEAYVVSTRDGIELRIKLGRGEIDVAMLEQAREAGMPVDGLVTGVNKGGLEVSVGGARGFCPIGQADIGFVAEPQELVGKTLRFLVKEVRERGRNVVLSRRALLEQERQVQAEKLLATLEVGQRVEATITRLLSFGAFAELGGLEGLIPISEISYARVEKPEDVLAEGARVTVEVLRIEPDPKREGKPRIALSLKATQTEPFVAHQEELVEGALFEGEVVKIEKYGAFVELFPGLSGLVHVSEIADRRIRHPSDVVSLGERISVRVLGVDAEQRRISLSMRAADEQPAAVDGDSIVPGAPVEGTVERVERYGVFVALGGGVQALMPAAESGTPPNTELARAFPLGTKLQLTVLSIDDRGRVRVSKKAREQAEERALVSSYNQTQRGGGKGFGTLGDLLKSKQQRAKR